MNSCLLTQTFTKSRNILSVSLYIWLFLRYHFCKKFEKFPLIGKIGLDICKKLIRSRERRIEQTVNEWKGAFRPVTNWTVIAVYMVNCNLVTYPITGQVYWLSFGTNVLHITDISHRYGHFTFVIWVQHCTFEHISKVNIYEFDLHPPLMNSTAYFN